MRDKCNEFGAEAMRKWWREKDYSDVLDERIIGQEQKHDAIRAIAQAMGEKYGVPFVYRDFRPLFQSGQEFAREHGMYMQKYCGCIFSEEDRYMAAKRKKRALRAAAQEE